MKINRYTFIAFQINAAREKHTFSIDEIKTEINNGTIFDFLKDRTKVFDISLLTEKEKMYLLKQWQSFASADIDIKLCIESNMNGLTLLVGYLLEGIQSELL